MMMVIEKLNCGGKPSLTKYSCKQFHNYNQYNFFITHIMPNFNLPVLHFRLWQFLFWEGIILWRYVVEHKRTKHRQVNCSNNL